MGKLGRIATALAVWLLGNAVGYQVLVHNQKNGIYSPDADTILIPIVENGAISIVVVLLLAGSILCSRRGVAVTFFGIVLGILACILAGLMAFQWFVPNHYLIAAAFGVLAAACALLMYVSFRKQGSNSTLHPDARGTSVLHPSARAGERGR
jgi:hypothetical protein